MESRAHRPRNVQVFVGELVQVERLDLAPDLVSRHARNALPEVE
jgi:hypothetical protein